MLEEVVGRRVHPDDPVEDLRAVLAAHDIAFLDDWSSGKLIFEMYDHLLQPQTLRCGREPPVAIIDPLHALIRAVPHPGERALIK